MFGLFQTTWTELLIAMGSLAACIAIGFGSVISVSYSGGTSILGDAYVTTDEASSSSFTFG